MFSEKILNSIKQFRDKHFKKKCYIKTNKPDAYKIKVTATGIGDAITIKCKNCGKEEDITDYDSW